MSEQEELRKFLDGTALFKDLSEADQKRLVAIASIEQYRPGEPVVEESNTGADIYAVMSGRVQICLELPNSSENEVIATLKEGDIFGETVLLGRQRRIATVTAKENVTVAKISATELNDYVAADPKFGFVIMKNLAGILHDRLTSTNMMLRNTFNNMVDLL